MTDRLLFLVSFDDDDDDDDEGVYLFVEVRDLLRFQVTNLSLSSKILFFLFPSSSSSFFSLFLSINFSG